MIKNIFQWHAVSLFIHKRKDREKSPSIRFILILYHRLNGYTGSVELSQMPALGTSFGGWIFMSIQSSDFILSFPVMFYYIKEIIYIQSIFFQQLLLFFICVSLLVINLNNDIKICILSTSKINYFLYFLIQ